MPAAALRDMKLPNGDRAIVDDRKLTGYCLNTDHPRGRHKARVFSYFGIRAEHAQVLREALLAAARHRDAAPGTPFHYGNRYTVDFDFSCGGNSVRIRSLWIIRVGEEAPRLTSCYVL